MMAGNSLSFLLFHHLGVNFGGVSLAVRFFLPSVFLLGSPQDSPW